MKLTVQGLKSAVLRIHRHVISFVEETGDEGNQLVEPATLLNLDYEADLQVEIVRNV